MKYRENEKQVKKAVEKPVEPEKKEKLFRRLFIRGRK